MVSVLRIFDLKLLQFFVFLVLQFYLSFFFAFTVSVFFPGFDARGVMPIYFNGADNFRD